MEKGCLLRWRLGLLPAALAACSIFLGPPPPRRPPPAAWRCRFSSLWGHAVPSGAGKRVPIGGWWQGLFRHPVHHFLIKNGSFKGTPCPHALGSCWLSPANLRDGWVLPFFIPLHPHNLSPGKMLLGKPSQRAGPWNPTGSLAGVQSDFFPGSTGPCAG